MSRDNILAAIRRNKPTAKPLPEIPDFSPMEADINTQFQQVVESGGGRVITIPEGQSPADWFRGLFPEARAVVTTVDGFPATIDLGTIVKPTELSHLDVAILPGRWGVAENGAIWLSEREMGQRVVPFITQHLIIVLSRENILATMHEAYGKIQINETGFGLFVAGPSKTADIEQSLVIGAQGARSLTVLMV